MAADSELNRQDQRDDPRGPLEAEEGCDPVHAPGETITGRGHGHRVEDGSNFDRCPKAEEDLDHTDSARSASGYGLRFLCLWSLGHDRCFLPGS